MLEDATKEAMPSAITRMLTDGGPMGGTASKGSNADRTSPGGMPGPLAPLGPSPVSDPSTTVQIIPARARHEIPKPVWHPPWKLMRVLSGHEGWVRSVKVDPTNEWFASTGNDRLIKIWDLASGTLKLSLTGHINTVRCVAISDRHP